MAFFEQLRREANDATGEVTLPHALIGWRGTDGKVESLPLTNVPLKLRFKDWEPRASASSDPSAAAGSSKVMSQIEKAMLIKKATEEARAKAKQEFAEQVAEQAEQMAALQAKLKQMEAEKEARQMTDQENAM